MPQAVPSQVASPADTGGQSVHDGPQPKVDVSGMHPNPQSWYPGLQTDPQTPFVHVAVVPVAAGQSVAQSPQ